MDFGSFLLIGLFIGCEASFIILLASLLVNKRLVGFVDFCEELSRVLRFAHVGMVNFNFFKVSSFNLSLGCIVGHVEHG